MPVKRFPFLPVLAILLGALFGASGVVYLSALPSFSHAWYAVDGDTERKGNGLPLDIPEVNQSVTATVSVILGPLHPSRYALLADDCVEAVWVNDVPLVDPSLPLCNVDAYVADVGAHLRSGENTLQVRVVNHGGPGKLHVRVAPLDPLFLGVRFALFGSALAVLCFFVLLAARGKRPGKLRPKRSDDAARGWSLAVTATFLGGCVLRLLYALGTAYHERSYDADGHLEYIKYVTTTLRLPPVHGGWEFFQPPLYYFLSALLVLPAKILRAPEVVTLDILQIESLLLSCLALALGVWAGHLLWHAERERAWRLLFCAVLAVYPGLVFFASRISNDTLILTLAFGFFAFLYRWWQRGDERDFVVASFLVAGGILTKSNAFAWVGIVLGVVTLKPKLPWKRALRLGALHLCLLGLLTGWFLGYRYVVERQEHIVGNIESNNGALRIQTIEPRNFYTFRPQEIVRVPYNSSWTDEYGRRYFWEHLFKSTIVGEWNFGERLHDVTRAIFILLMILIPCALAGLVLDLRSSLRAHAPLWLAAIVLLASMMLLVIHEPIGGFQDFRYVQLLIVPAFFYAFRGLQALPRLGRRIGQAACVALIVLCVVFVGMLLYG